MTHHVSTTVSPWLGDQALVGEWPGKSTPKARAAHPAGGGQLVSAAQMRCAVTESPAVVAGRWGVSRLSSLVHTTAESPRDQTPVGGGQLCREADVVMDASTTKSPVGSHSGRSGVIRTRTRFTSISESRRGATPSWWPAPFRGRDTPSAMTGMPLKPRSCGRLQP
jgi:hypothetical protein